MNGKQEKRETWQTYHDLKNKYHRFQIERKRESTVLPFAVAAHWDPCSRTSTTPCSNTGTKTLELGKQLISSLKRRIRVESGEK